MPTAMPETGLLSTYLAACARNGWNPNADVRMEGEELSEDEAAALDALTDDQVDALQSLTDEDVDALSALTDEQMAELAGGGTGDRRITEARRQTARFRRELKPWKALANEYGVTPDEVREAIEAHLADDDDDDDDDDDKSKRRKPKERRRQPRDTSAEDRANAKLVKAEVKTAAVETFADPGDVHLYLDLDKYEVDEDGELVDPDELEDDLLDLLERKPHLAKKRERKSPKPLQGQGRREATSNTGLDAGRERARARFGKSTNGDS